MAENEDVPLLRTVPPSPRAVLHNEMLDTGLRAPGREPLWRHMLGDRLRRLRLERGETLGQAAGRAGISPQYLSEIERGIKDPSSEMIAAVAGALDVALVDLTLGVADDLQATTSSGARVRPLGTAPGRATCRAVVALAA